MKRLAKALALGVLGFITTATIDQSIGTGYAIAALVAGSALIFMNESEAK